MASLQDLLTALLVEALIWLFLFLLCCVDKGFEFAGYKSSWCIPFLDLGMALILASEFSSYWLDQL